LWGSNPTERGRSGEEEEIDKGMTEDGKEAWHEEGRSKARFGVERAPAEGTEGEMMIGCEGKKGRWGKGR